MAGEGGAALAARVQFVRAGARAAGGQSKVYLNPSDMSSLQIRAGESVAVLRSAQEQVEKQEEGEKQDMVLACGVAWPMDKVKRRGVGLSAMWEAAVSAQAEVAVVPLVSSAAAVATAVGLQVVAPQRRWPGGSGGGDAPSTRERALLSRYVQAMLGGVLLHPGALLMLPVHGVATTMRVLRVDKDGSEQQTQGVDAAVMKAVARVSASTTQVSIRWDTSAKCEAQGDTEEKASDEDGLSTAMGSLSVGGDATRDAVPPTTSTEGFAAVGGLQKEIKAIREVIEQPLVNPGLFRRFGLPAPKGVLMFGPPGTGKTLIARALATELRARVFFVNGPEVVSKFVGESEANLRAVFAQAARAAPALIFIDEIDALCPKRDARVGDMEKRLVATLLTLMDGLEGDAAGQRGHVVVLGATNRANALDPAIRRPGRFDREVEIGIPSARDRLDILRVTLRRLPHALTDVQLEELAGSAHGYVGADLSALCKEAALLALQRAFGQSDAASDGLQAGGNPLRERLPPFRIQLEDLRVAMRGVRPSALRELAVEVPRVFWRDIGGQQALKQQLREAVEWPLAHPEAFVRLGIRPPKGVLLYGPPGCSKTLAAKALATESQMNFLAVKGPELFSKWVGESERAVQQLFRKARAAAPTVVFFDEIDALASSSRGLGGGGSSQVADRVLSQLLTELDGVEPLRQVLVVAATNRPDLLDPALLRPGRIDRALFVGPPDVQGREEILRVHTRRLPLASDVQLAQLAVATARFSGAELAALCREAAMAAIDEQREGAERVATRHFLRALERVQPQIDDAMLAFFEGFRRQRQ